LSLRYSFQPETVDHYTVVIAPYWWDTTWFKVTLGVGVPVALALLAFINYRNRKRSQMSVATQALRSVQAQLNPHFIFNALTSIQGLINTGDIDGANAYLSAFSVMMRNTLEDQEHLNNRLGAELDSMETYLSLEQLRFHFQYSVRVEPGLNPNAIEIPRLLLQPIIENAVRHGVSGLREEGLIRVSAFARSPDLLITIQDNGPGFVSLGTGHGLRLTEDRILLLNRLNPQNPIHLSREGSTFTFTFVKWLI
jgi:LytS/YehU family sensor histidine kinase